MILKLGRYITSKIKTSRAYSSSTFKMATCDRVGVPMSRVISALENFAPKELSESWDNTGLLVEPYTPREIIKKIFLTNDLTEDVAIEAKNKGCEMIISYHPPIFAPLKSVVQSEWKQRTVSFLLENRIALYSPHTCWDCVQGGVNDWLASAFNVAHSQPITPSRTDPNIGAGRLLKLVKPIMIAEAIERVKRLTALRHVRFGLGKGQTTASEIETVALCAGSGTSVLKGISAGLYLTGEMLHHDVLDATQKGISVILTNHSDSERGFLKVFSEELFSRLDKLVDVHTSDVDKDPLVVV